MRKIYKGTDLHEPQKWEWNNLNMLMEQKPQKLNKINHLQRLEFNGMCLMISWTQYEAGDVGARVICRGISQIG